MPVNPRLLFPRKISLKKSDTSENIKFKKLSSSAILFSEFSNTSSIYINNTKDLSSNVNFIRSLQIGSGNSNLPASALFYYKANNGKTATGSVTALYEFLRGYLYRDDSSPSVSSISSVLISKNSTNSLTGFRMIMFNKEIKADLIKPTSFRMSVTPVNIILNNPEGLYFSNSGVIDNVTTGAYSSITSDISLSGSLIKGTVGSVLTGFTILIKAKPEQGGPPIQTLFHRRIADITLSSLNYNQSIPGTNNIILTSKYSDNNPLSACLNMSIWNWGAIFWDSIPLWPPTTWPVSTAIILSNSGGGILHFSCSSSVDDTPNWLSISSTELNQKTVVSSSLSSLNNINSNTAIIIAYLNDSISSKIHQGILNGYVTFYNSPGFLDKAPNLPLTILVRGVFET